MHDEGFPFPLFLIIGLLMFNAMGGCDDKAKAQTRTDGLYAMAELGTYREAGSFSKDGTWYGSAAYVQVEQQQGLRLGFGPYWDVGGSEYALRYGVGVLGRDNGAALYHEAELSWTWGILTTNIGRAWDNGQAIECDGTKPGTRYFARAGIVWTVRSR